jgi:hypothetical protein
MTGSSFSIATTAFVSLAICAIISYGVFYYFKQRLSLIEQSQMEQARIMQAIISRGLQPQHLPQQATQQLNSDQPAAQCHKEITITQNSLIEVSSDDESETDESESESSDTESESGSESESDKWSIGDEIHQSDAYHKEFNDMSEKMRALSEKKQIHIDNVENIDDIDDIEIENIEPNADDANTKKIISLKSAHNHEENESDEEESSSSESESEEKTQDFELKIGYKSASASASASAANKDASKALHLNYGNMSVPALRQLAKERGLGGDDGDLQKLKKKDLVQLLQ